MGQRYRCHDDVATEAAGDEMLLVHLGSGGTFRLNRTGAAIWELARAGLTPREIAETLRRSFAVPLARLEADASGLMTELAREGLLELLKKGGS